MGALRGAGLTLSLSALRWLGLSLGSGTMTEVGKGTVVDPYPASRRCRRKKFLCIFQSALYLLWLCGWVVH